MGVLCDQGNRNFLTGRPNEVEPRRVDEKRELVMGCNYSVK